MTKVLIDHELLEQAASMELDTTARSIRIQDELRALLGAKTSGAKHYWPEEIVGTGELVVYLSDYATLEAECERLKNSLLAITARHFAESWKKRTSDAELEQYLSAGIAQLEAERDALAAELAAIKGQERGNE